MESDGARLAVLADTGRVRQVLCPVLVGREEETALLRAALTAAQAGRGGTVLMTGEAGIGKSRLIRETAHAARGRDVVVLAGRAVGGGVPTPFRPFAEALAWAARGGGLHGHEKLDAFRPALGRLVPQWRQVIPAGGQLGWGAIDQVRVAVEDDGQGGRRRLNRERVLVPA